MKVESAKVNKKASLEATAEATKANRTLLHSGFCYYCYERVHSPYLFCDDECQSDYYKEKNEG